MCKQQSQRISYLLVLLLCLAGTAYAFRYMYFSDTELTVFGDRFRFFSGDTLQGPIRTNDCFLINPPYSPVSYDCIIMGCSCPDSVQRNSNGCIQCNAPYMPFPRAVDNVRTGAIIQEHFYNTPHRQGAVVLTGSTAQCYEWPLGTPFDSTFNHWTVPIDGQVCLFFDYPIWVKGRLTGQLSIATSHDLGIADNVAYSDADLTPRGAGRVSFSSRNILMLAADGDVKVLNTPANGRENSGGRGLSQSNLDSTSVFITAAIYAAGESFTFEQQNDADSGYIYQNPVGTPARDDRGTIYLYGSLAQQRHGYVHRGTNGSTGYLKQYVFDWRFREMAAPYEYYDWTNPTPSTIDFGSVAVNTTVRDTADVYLPVPGTLYAVTASAPFYSSTIPPFQTDHFRIPLRFTPVQTRQYSGILYVNTSQQIFQITLRGRGLPGGAPPLVFDISPNPFNLTTTLHYTLEQTGPVKITLHDILGRTAKEMDLGSVESGEHTVQLNAADLASGVYFVRLQSGEQIATKKILLLK